MIDAPSQSQRVDQALLFAWETREKIDRAHQWLSNLRSGRKIIPCGIAEELLELLDDLFEERARGGRFQ